jgi:hypothetical protein
MTMESIERIKPEPFEPKVTLEPYNFIKELIPYPKLFQKTKSFLFHLHEHNHSSSKVTTQDMKIILKTVDSRPKKTYETQKQQTQEPLQIFSMETSSSTQNKKPTKRGSFSEEEKLLFEEGLKKLGRNWTAISKNFVKTRTRRQVGNYARKYFDDKQIEE